MTLRQQIVNAIIVQLNTGRPPDVPPAEPLRTVALDTDSLDAVLVYRLRDVSNDVGGRRGQIVKRQLELAIEHWAQERESVAADEAVEPYLAWSVKALTDQSLGGLVSFIREAETNFAFGVAQRGYCLATLTLLVDYQQRADDLELRT